MSKLICKARSLTLDIELQRKWKYADTFCIGCKIKEESGDEILRCKILNNENSVSEIQIGYQWFYSKDVSDIVRAGKLMAFGLKERNRIVEAAVT